jgi:hypothetical protein
MSAPQGTHAAHQPRRLAAAMIGQRYTIQQAAVALGTSKKSLLRWEAQPDFPIQVRRSRPLPNGKPGARWYDQADIEKIFQWKWGSSLSSMNYIRSVPTGNSPLRAPLRARVR